MTFVRWIKILLVLVLLGFGGLLLWGYGRNHPQDLPWTALDLGQPIGAFTGRKLAGLEGEGEKCRSLLTSAGVRFDPVPARAAAAQCGYEDAVRLRRGGAFTLAFRPRDVATSCPVAAALALWEWHVVQPAALQHFGSGVAGIEHFGSYSCRRIYGRSEGQWSEHATANAIDIAGFRLADGRRISVLGDWKDEGPRGRFLHQVRDGACRLFATTLSPDYNAAHRDHLHLDQADRGAMGWRGCR
jgi:hypothetical protein